MHPAESGEIITEFETKLIFNLPDKRPWKMKTHTVSGQTERKQKLHKH